MDADSPAASSCFHFSTAWKPCQEAFSGSRAGLSDRSVTKQKLTMWRQATRRHNRFCPLRAYQLRQREEGRVGGWASSAFHKHQFHLEAEWGQKRQRRCSASGNTARLKLIEPLSSAKLRRPRRTLMNCKAL